MPRHKQDIHHICGLYVVAYGKDGPLRGIYKTKEDAEAHTNAGKLVRRADMTGRKPKRRKEVIQADSFKAGYVQGLYDVEWESPKEIEGRPVYSAGLLEDEGLGPVTLAI